MSDAQFIPGLGVVTMIAPEVKSTVPIDTSTKADQASGLTKEQQTERMVTDGINTVRVAKLEEQKAAHVLEGVVEKAKMLTQIEAQVKHELVGQEASHSHDEIKEEDAEYAEWVKEDEGQKETPVIDAKGEAELVDTLSEKDEYSKDPVEDPGVDSGLKVGTKVYVPKYRKEAKIKSIVGDSAEDEIIVEIEGQEKSLTYDQIMPV